ncbi:MAG: hypothetical protein MR663_03110 [Lachnospiraceae bacterium]|nr:hypothetical protein [Lachnospiraceae bacterium]
MISFTELFDGKTTCKILPQKAQDEEQAVAGIRDNDIRKNGVCMLTAVTENPHHTKVGLYSYLRVQKGGKRWSVGGAHVNGIKLVVTIK